MKKITLIFATLFMLAGITSANAGGLFGGNTNNNTTNNTTNNITNTTNNKGGKGGDGGAAYSKSKAVGVGVGISHAGAKSDAKSKSGANSSNELTINETHPSSQKIRSVGIAVAPDVMPTAPCMGSSSVGVGFMGGAFSGGNTWTDDDCSYRETSRMLDAMGYKKDAIHVMCQSEYAKAAPSCKALKAAEVAAAPKKEANYVHLSDGTAVTHGRTR